MVRETPRLVSMAALFTSVGMSVAGIPSALADVAPTSETGPPEMVKPTFYEVGAPSFVTPVGSQDPATGTPTSPGGDGDVGTGSIGFVATDYNQYLGQAVGSGQCVALVQAADPSVGLTATWRQGDAVQGNASLSPGTVIATFDQNGRYANATDGSSHAAIYLGQNAQGIQVEDQWAGHAASIRTIYWNNPAGVGADTGTAFHVVTHA